MGEAKMEIAAYGFLVMTIEFLRMRTEGRLDELRTMGMDKIEGFIAIRNEGLSEFLPIYHTWLYLTPEGRDEGLRLAKNAGLHPERIDEPIMIPADVIINKPEAVTDEDD